jgi:hypothetical protein
MKKFNLFKKKLSLNKETITILDKKKLETINGGVAGDPIPGVDVKLGKTSSGQCTMSGL